MYFLLIQMPTSHTVCHLVPQTQLQWLCQALRMVLLVPWISLSQESTWQQVVQEEFFTFMTQQEQ